MITLTRLSGSAFALNSDLIERVDATPDTVVTLVDGTKYVVQESLQSIVEAVRDYRGQIVAAGARVAELIESGVVADVVTEYADPPAPHLAAVPAEEA